MTNISYKDDKFIELIYKVANKNKPTYVKYGKIKKYINKEMIYKLKQEIDKHEGGFLPLLALLPLIFGGFAAAGGATAGIATAVSSAKQTAEQKRHNVEIERIAKASPKLTEFAKAKEKEGGCLCEDADDREEETEINKIKAAIVLLQRYGFHFV